MGCTFLFTCGDVYSAVLPAIYYRSLKINEGVEVLLIDIYIYSPHTYRRSGLVYTFYKSNSTTKQMAVARQIEIHKGEDGVVAVRRDVIVDPELGIAAEVEKVIAAVDVGGGKVALLEKTRVKAIPNLVRSIF